MADKPIIMTGTNVIRILTCKHCGKISISFPCEHCGSTEFCKGQTRRIIKQQPQWIEEAQWWIIGFPKGKFHHLDFCRRNIEDIKKLWLEHYPHYKVGDTLWVREGYRIPNMDLDREQALMVYYRADRTYKSVAITEAEMKLFKGRKYPFRMTPGRFMYKSLARIFLEVTKIRVERLKEITWEDIIAEGCDVAKPTGDPAVDDFTAGVETFDTFRYLWNSIHGEGAWDRNEWLFVYDFKRISNGRQSVSAVG